ARTLRGLALTAYELRDYVESLEFAERALASSVRPLTPQMRAEVQQTRDAARRFVARVKLAVEPESAAGRVEGRVATRDGEGRLLLNPGSHALSAQAPGLESIERALEAQSGDELQLELVLRAPQPDTAQPAALVATSAPPPAAATERDGSH